ncbi:serine/threonine-protein phosphatase 7 long form homolog [Manihot esculenta]|uniref:serine/threonine-protein phosphatase 7 long form homolog n=1 Tax=Manihot esculenta TaxID=3983 RepID=UPI000B5D0DB7|nr:serine/threonine-protein phosphatase 7 long form homolog [Manihot esculenta]
MFPEGEITITLQDVGLITGLPVNGAAVTGRSRHHWSSVCEALLGVVPPNNAIRGCYLKMNWLAEEFSQLPDEADEEVVHRFARAYIMRVIGSIFSDTSASRVNLMFLPLLTDLEEAGNYSWGGACLAWLYRQLCKATNPEVMQMAGPLFIVQIWAWDWITAVSPALSNRVPHHDAPLGSRWKWHQPDRVMRQFGMQQHIPVELQQSAALHDVDLRKSDTNWAKDDGLEHMYAITNNPTTGSMTAICDLIQSV